MSRKGRVTRVKMHITGQLRNVEAQKFDVRFEVVPAEARRYFTWETVHWDDLIDKEAFESPAFISLSDIHCEPGRLSLKMSFDSANYGMVEQEYESTDAELTAAVNGVLGTDGLKSFKATKNPNEAYIIYEENETAMKAFKIPIFKNISPSLPCYLRAGGKETQIYAMIDTGAQHSIIAPELVEALGLKPFGSATMGTFNGELKTRRVSVDVDFKSDTLELLKGLDCIIGKLERLYDASAPVAHHNCGLILGFDVLMDYNILLKPEEQCMYLASKVGG
jgi:hypothetical protein